MEEQVISKQGVADHGEVLTRKREVNAMLDLVKQETERIDAHLLEPACGTGILAATTLRYFELGLVVAVLYFGMSYPLSILARRIERRLRGAK